MRFNQTLGTPTFGRHLARHFGAQIWDDLGLRQARLTHPDKTSPKRQCYSPEILQISQQLGAATFQPAFGANPPTVSTSLGNLRLRKARLTHPCKTPSNSLCFGPKQFDIKSISWHSNVLPPFGPPFLGTNLGQPGVETG